MHAQVAYQPISPPKTLFKITRNEYPVADHIYYFNVPNRGINLVYYQEAKSYNMVLALNESTRVRINILDSNISISNPL